MVPLRPTQFSNPRTATVYGSPKLTHILRSSPCANHNILPDIDATLRSCLINISNVDINDMQWQQASLPIKAGGLGIRNMKSIASPAFFAFVSKTKQFQNFLLSRCSNVFLEHHYDFYLDDWCKYNQSIQTPVNKLSIKQKPWEKPVIDKICPISHASQSDEHNRARLLAASAAQSGDYYYYCYYYYYYYYYHYHYYYYYYYYYYY